MVSYRTRIRQTIESLVGQLFSFPSSGVAFGFLDREGEVKPYTVEYVRSVLDAVGEPSCSATAKLDTDEKLQGCFARSVERSLRDASSRYETFITKLKSGELGDTLGFTKGKHWWNTAVDTKDIPAYRSGTSVPLSSLVSGGVNREKLAEKLRAPDKSWSRISHRSHTATTS